MVLYRETPEKKLRDRFHEGLNSDCYTLLIYKDTILTEEQIKAQHDFFLRRYYINADPVVWKSQENHTIRSHNHEIFTQTLNAPMTRQENHSNESFKRITGDDNIHTFSRTHEWDIVNVFTCERFKLPWNQGCLQNVKEMFLK